MPSWLRCGVILLALPVSAGQRPQPISCVIDDALKDPALLEFRRQLLRTIRTRNVGLLEALVDPELTYEVGERGWKQFSKSYRLGDPKSVIWTQLESDLSLGGRLIDGEFCAPYFMCPTWPGTGDETVLVVLRSGVPMREKPDGAAALISSSACGVVSVPSSAAWPDTPAGWSAVWLSSKGWGFMESADVVTAQTSVYLARRNGRWLLTAILGID